MPINGFKGTRSSIKAARACEGCQDDGVDDDIVQFATSVYYCEEERDCIDLTVVRLGDRSGVTQVDYCTVDGSAIANKHFVFASGCLTFDPGVMLQTIRIAMIDNDEFDSVLEFAIVLENIRGGRLGRYLYTASIKLSDADAFPTTDCKAKLKEGKARAWTLYRSFLRMNLQDRAIRRSFVTYVLIDQLMNMKLVLDMFLIYYLINDVLQAEEAECDPGCIRMRVLFVVAGMIIPQVLVIFLRIAQIELGIRTKVINRLQLNLFRRFLYYDEGSRSHVSSSDLTMAIIRCAPDVTDNAVSGLLATMQKTGLLVLTLIYAVNLQMDGTGDLYWVAISGGGVPICMGIFLAFRQKLSMKRRRDVHDTETDVLAIIHQASDCFRLITDYLQRPMMIDSFSMKTGSYNRACKRQTLTNTINMQVGPLLTSIVIAAYVFGRYEDFMYQPAIGEFVSGVAAWVSIGQACHKIYEDFCKVQSALEPLENIVFYMNLPVDVPGRLVVQEMTLAAAKTKLVEAAQWLTEIKRHKSKKPGAREQRILSPDLVSIQVQGLNFRYPGRDTFILNNAGFEIPQGKLVAISGPRAGGKSTLMKLLGSVLCHPPDTGLFFIPSHLRVLHVGDRAQLMGGMDILDNLLLGISDDMDSDQRAVNICRRLGMSDLVMKKIMQLVDGPKRSSSSSQVKRSSTLADKDLASEIRNINKGGTQSTSSGLSKSKTGAIIGSQSGHIEELSDFDYSEGTPQSVVDRAMAREAFNLETSLSHTDKWLLHIARALIMNPEVLVIHKPLAQFEDVHKRLIVGLLREFVDERGVELPSSERQFRRLRTCIFSVQTSKYTEVADLVFKVGHGQVTQVRGLTRREALRKHVQALFDHVDQRPADHKMVEEAPELSLAEWQAGAPHAPYAAELMGLVGGQATQEAVTRVFKEIDLDGNGTLDRESLVRHVEKTHGEKLEYVLAYLGWLSHTSAAGDVAEVPREARLPRAGGFRKAAHVDTAHAEAELVRQAAARRSVSQVWVAEPSRRGIQLGELLDFFQEHCGELTFVSTREGRLPVCISTKLIRRCAEWNQAHWQQIAAKEVERKCPDTYGVRDLFIGPLTEKQRVSYSELLHPGGALVTTYIAHFWGEDFGEFCQSLYRYALSDTRKKEPSLSDKMQDEHARSHTFYVCAFCNNQWRIEEETDSKSEEAFFKTVLQAPTTEKVVFHVGKQGLALYRAWWCFELFSAHRLRNRKTLALNTPFGPAGDLQVGGQNPEEVMLWGAHIYSMLQLVDLRKSFVSRAGDFQRILEEVSNLKGTEVAEGLVGVEAVNSVVKSVIVDEILGLLVKTGHPGMVQGALNMGASAKGMDPCGVPILTHATALHGAESAVARVLLENGADAQAQNRAREVVDMFNADAARRKAAINQVLMLDETTREFFGLAIYSAEAMHRSRQNRAHLKALEGDSVARLRALEAVTETHHEVDHVLLDPIVGCLSDTDASVRYMAALALSRVGSAVTAHHVVAALKRLLPNHGESPSSDKYPAAETPGDVDAGVVLMAERALAKLHYT